MGAAVQESPVVAWLIAVGTCLRLTVALPFINLQYIIGNVNSLMKRFLISNPACNAAHGMAAAKGIRNRFTTM